MKIAICDDELLHLQRTSQKIKSAFEKVDPFGDHMYKKYNSPIILLAEHEKIFFDVAFLDIDMPHINGMDVADLLAKLNPLIYIIYVTSHESFARSALRHRIFRFILKSENKEFEEAVSSLLKRYNKEHKKILLQDAGIDHEFDLSQVLYFSSGHNFANIHYLDGRIMRSNLKMADLEKQLLENWVYRVNKGTLVNFCHIYKIDFKKKNSLILTTGEQIPISRRRYDDVVKLFMKCITDK